LNISFAQGLLSGDALCLIERYEFRFAELNEMLVHRLHAVFVAPFFDVLLDLIEFMSRMHALMVDVAYITSRTGRTVSPLFPV